MNFKNWFMKDMSKENETIKKETADTLHKPVDTSAYDTFTKKTIARFTKVNEERECPECGGAGYYDQNGNEPCEECEGEGYIDDGFITIKPRSKAKGKDKEQKKFEIGDVLLLTDKNPSSKMPPDANDFLLTYKTFTVIGVNDNGKLNLGCRISKNENGKGVEKIYMFSPNRFDLKDPRPVVEKPFVEPVIEPIVEPVAEPIIEPIAKSVRKPAKPRAKKKVVGASAKPRLSVDDVFRMDDDLDDVVRKSRIEKTKDLPF